MIAIHGTGSASTINCVRRDDGWYSLGSMEQVFGSRACRGVDLEGVKVGLFRVNEEVHALDDICTHGAALLTDGEFDGHEVECPLHAGLVDVRTGRALGAPITREARRHDTKIVGDELFVRLHV